MQLVSHGDPLMEMSETMAQWYNAFQTARKMQGQGKVKRNEHLDYPVRKYPNDPSSYWILHLLDCTAPPSAATPRLKKAGVDPSELEDSDGKSLLMITDASGLPLGFDLLDRGWSSSLGGVEEAAGDSAGAMRTLDKIVELLQWSIEFPMSGGRPRRPQELRVNDRLLHRLLIWQTYKRGNEILNMKLCPQALGGWDPVELEEEGAKAAKNRGQGPKGRLDISMLWPPTRYCNVCKKRSFPSQLKPCPRCKAVLYCSDQCSHADRTKCPEDASHEHWCAKLARCMDHGAQLADMPFSYAAEVTSEDFDLERFLCKNKLDSGYWLHWSFLLPSPRCELHPAVEQSKDPYSHWLTGHSDAYGPLKQEKEVLLCGPGPHTPPGLTKPLGQYYQWRGLSLSSPVAPLLSSALSIYYIITSLVPNDFPGLNILQKRSLRIHVFESYREFHTLMTFWELSVLLPHVTFELVFIGEELPEWSDKEQFFMQKKVGFDCLDQKLTNPRTGTTPGGDGRVTLINPSLTSEKADKRSVRVRGYRRAYCTLQGVKPDLVIGFKPSILLHESWLSTLPRLQSLNVPAYFCEASELSCECSLQVMSQATGGTLSSRVINPFHCPLRVTRGGNMLPWYSNGFISHLVYEVVVNCQSSAVAAHPAGPPTRAEPANPAPEPAKLSRKERKAAAHNLPCKRK